MKEAIDKVALINRIDELSALKGVNVTTALIESGAGKNFKSNMSTSEPSLGKLTLLANYFGVSVEYLLGKTNKKEKPVDKFDEHKEYESVEIIYYNVIGKVAAGYDGMAEEEYTGEVCPIPKMLLKGLSKDDYFVLRVTGNSMYPKLLDGDFVFVRRCTSVDSGSVAIVLYNGDNATIKKVCYDVGGKYLDLVPYNPEYTTKRIKGDDLINCRILGKVCKLLRDM